MKKGLAMVLCLMLLVSLVPVSALAATQITSVTVTNVPTPYAGSKVPVAATVNTTGAQFYSMDWYDKTAGRFLESTDYFTENHVYEVQLWVEAESGYEFRTSGAVPNVTATVGGKTATVSKAYEYQAWAMIVVSYTFEPCGKKEIKSVDLQLEGITKPGNGLRAEQGQYVPFSIQSGDEKVMLYPQLHTRYYPYGFRWSNSTKDTVAYEGDRFQGGCDYYVTIALKPRDSAFTFADDFTATIGGKSAQVKSLGKTYAEISVEVTCIGTIVGGNITPVVSLPRDGNSPDYSLTYDNCEYIDYATVTGWYDVETGARLLTSEHQFRGGKQYRVEVECTASYAYKFQRDANDKMEYAPMITGEKVDSYSFGYDSYRGREVIKLVKTFTAPVPDHTHSPSGWRTTGAYHYKVCTECGDFLEQEDHYGGKTTCLEGAKCDVCSYVYTQPNEEHTPDTKWTNCGTLYHAYLCTLCGAHCDPEEHRWSPKYHPVDATGHAYQCADCKGYDTIQAHIPGPAGTPEAEQVCRDCGYIITPAKDHIHNLEKHPEVPATCMEAGAIEHYTCNGCSGVFKDEQGKVPILSSDELHIGALGHTPGENWQTDSACHWRICAACGETLTETKMLHEINEGTCTTCGYAEGQTLPEDPTATDGPSDPGQGEENTPPSGEKESKTDWLLYGILAGVLLILALLLLLLRKKKKES